MTNPVSLVYRSVISVSGADAETFLNGIVTVSTPGMRTGEFRYGGLLTPQGKVIADLLLTRENDALLIDCAEAVAPAVVKRLSLMKLRAAVAIAPRPDLGVTVFTGSPDPRAAAAPHRSIGPRTTPGDAGAYHAARIAAGLPEQGFDFAAEEVFPADINMDLIGGVDFRKGCFIGQEVVSRMKRRGAARRRTLAVEVAPATEARTPILADGFEIGLLTSVSGGAGLARVRIDRLEEARAKGVAITAGGNPVVFDNPAWLAAELAALNEAKEPRA